MRPKLKALTPVRRKRVTLYRQSYHCANVCVSSEFPDLERRLLEDVFAEADLTEEVKRRIEGRFQATTAEKVEELMDEIELRRELGQLIHS